MLNGNERLGLMSCQTRDLTSRGIQSLYQKRLVPIVSAVRRRVNKLPSSPSAKTDGVCWNHISFDMFKEL